MRHFMFSPIKFFNINSVSHTVSQQSLQHHQCNSFNCNCNSCIGNSSNPCNSPKKHMVHIPKLYPRPTPMYVVFPMQRSAGSCSQLQRWEGSSLIWYWWDKRYKWARLQFAPRSILDLAGWILSELDNGCTQDCVSVWIVEELREGGNILKHHEKSAVTLLNIEFEGEISTSLHLKLDPECLLSH